MSTPARKRDKSQDLAVLGTTIAGKYRVLEVLGQGGFGSVFLVEIVAGMVGEKLALKLIPSEMSGDEKIKAQFLNEIRVAMRMVNKYIVQVRDVGETDDGQLYYTMDYCPGENLAGVLKRERKLAPARAIPIALRVLDALKTAHAAGVIHRDLKPANVMVFVQEGRETARVLDFGIATAIQAGRTGGTAFVGSPHYMPPEQFLNQELGFFTDTYSVGVILYECLTGQKPYPGKTPQEVYDDLKSRPVVPPGEINPELAAFPGLSAIISRALERNPELRYPTAKDLFNDLKAVLEGSYQPAAEPAPAAAAPVRRRRSAVALRSSKTNVASGLAVALAAAVLGTGVAIYLMSQEGDTPAAETVPVAPPQAVVQGGPPQPAPGPPPEPEPEPPRPPAPPVAVIDGERPAVTPRPEPTKVPKPVDVEAQKREDQERSRKRVALAVELARAERWDRVRDTCADALVLDSGNVEAYRLKGQAELKLGMFADASGSLRKARELIPPGKVDANLVLSLIDALAGQPGADPAALPPLLREARAALKRGPPNREGTVKLLLLLEKHGEERLLVGLIEEARAKGIDDPELKRLHQRYLVELPKEREAKARELLKLAEKALRERDFVLAAGKAQEGFLLKPLPELGLVLAEAHQESGKTRDALQTLGEVGRQVGEDSEGLVRVGILYGRAYLAEFDAGGRKKGESIERALQNLDAANDILGKDPKLKAPELVCAARTYRARCHALQGSLSKVDDDLKAARAAQDRDPEVIYHQAESYFLLGEKAKDPDRSAAYQRCINRLNWFVDFKEAKRDPRGPYLMGLCYLRLGGKRDNFDKAITNFSTAQRYGMKDLPALFEAWAEAYLGLGDHIRAGQKYRESFEVKKDEKVCIKAANCFLEANSRISAEKMVKDGLAEFPKSDELQKLLARIAR